MATQEQSLEENVTEISVPFQATRNYTGEDEKQEWWYIARNSKDRKWYYRLRGKYNPEESKEKEGFRTRRSLFGIPIGKTALRLRFERSNEIGVFIKLTNSYCLLSSGEEESDFLNTIKSDLSPDIPVINTSVAGCRILGRMCVGNKKGLLLPETIYNTEFQQIKNELPDSVKVEKIEERLSALGNVIACNDNVAIIHPDLNKETEEIIKNTLQVEVFRSMITSNPLVGTYCVLNNHGGLVCPGINNSELENLSSLLQIPLIAGTVNSGSKVIAAGLVVNDSIGYAGMKTTSNEFSVIESIFQLSYKWP